MNSLSCERERVFERLACPACSRAPLTRTPDALRCEPCGADYALRDGMPIMLSATERLEAEEVRYPAPSPSRAKTALAGLGLLGPARSLWHGWLRLDAALTPQTEASVETHVRRCASLLPRRPGEPISILDIGGGSGEYRKWLARESDTYAIVEIDPNNARVLKNLDRNVYVIANAHRLPFQPASFDAVCLFEVLEHLYNPFDAMHECARVLRPGGHLLLTVPQYWHVHGWPSDYFRYTIHGLNHLCRTAGLQVEQHWPMGGPFLLLESVAELNFSGLLRLPLVRHFVTRPLTKLCDWGDKIFFRNNTSRMHPDTRGWSLVARKP